MQLGHKLIKEAFVCLLVSLINDCIEQTLRWDIRLEVAFTAIKSMNKQESVMANYILHFNTSSEPSYPYWFNNAAGKCHFDREKVAEELGFMRIDAFSYSWPDEPQASLSSRMDGLLGGLQQNDCLIVQWPMPAFGPRWVNLFIDRVHFFGAKLIFLIDDMASWQMGIKPPDASSPEMASYLAIPTVAEEFNYLLHADGLIVHSDAMRSHLSEQLALAGKKLTDNISSYGPGVNKTKYFKGRRQLNNGVDYAGALHKAKFLQQLSADFKLNIYGAGPKDQVFAKNRAIRLHKRVDPEAIPQMLEGSFGLVWDSDAYPDVVGRWGEYERYNTPAKFPMYLSANEPVIVWSQAATAPFVEANQIGLTIDSMDQLVQAVQSVTKEQYDKMLTNVERISPLIRDGFFLKKAIVDVMSKVYVDHKAFS